MYSNKKITLALAIATLLAPTFVFAATAPAPAATGNNSFLISLSILFLVLLIVIGILANSLNNIVSVLRDKFWAERNASSGVLKTIAFIFSFGLVSLSGFAAETSAKTDSNIGGVPASDFYLITTVIVLEAIVILILLSSITRLKKIISSSPGTYRPSAKRSWFWDEFNAAATDEKDVLLDHNYDGIQELDNSLPPWWKYGFYITIVVACIYFYRYHIAQTAPLSKEEYVLAMQQGEEEKAAYLAASGNKIDENNVTLLTDATDIAAGKEIFVKTCAPCHLPDGGGVVGPNLTDDYWLHGGSIKDIFKTIKYGWQDKGMKSWKDDFSAKQIQQLASFVKSLKGTHPATPKAPQGELYIEASSSPSAADSTKK